MADFFAAIYFLKVNVLAIKSPWNKKNFFTVFLNLYMQ